MNARTIVFVAAAGIVLVAGTPAAADLVKLTDGTWLVDTPANDPPTAEELRRSRLVVEAEDHDFLRYRLRRPGMPLMKRPRRDVARVYYFRRDPTYTEALEAISRRDWEAAEASLRKAASSRLRWVRHHALLQLVRFHDAGAEKEKALAAANSLLEAFPRTKDLVETIERMGRLQLDLGRADEARATFGRLKAIPGLEDAADLAGYWSIHVDERLVRTPEQLDPVLARYGRFLEEIGRASDLAPRARLGRARCLLGAQRYDEALEMLNDVAGSATDPEILAAAYVGIGHVHFSREEWKDARRAYLRVCVLWRTDPDLRREALRKAGNCFLLVRDEGYRTHARRLLEEAQGRLAWD